MQRKPSRIWIGKLFGIPKSPDIGTYSENVLGKYRECAPRWPN